MENVMEALMVIAMCFAVGIMLYRFAANKGIHRAMDRITVITIGVGFIIGSISKARIYPVPQIFGLYVLGAWLCYIAAIFSFPGKEGQHHE